MIVYTTCDNCKKALRADLSHKEAVAVTGEARKAAIIQCEYCRSEIDVFITTLTRESKSEQ